MDATARKQLAKIKKRLWKAKKHEKKGKTGATERKSYWKQELTAHRLKNKHCST